MRKRPERRPPRAGGLLRALRCPALAGNSAKRFPDWVISSRGGRRCPFGRVPDRGGGKMRRLVIAILVVSTCGSRASEVNNLFATPATTPPADATLSQGFETDYRQATRYE